MKRNILVIFLLLSFLACNLEEDKSGNEDENPIVNPDGSGNGTDAGNGIDPISTEKVRVIYNKNGADGGTTPQSYTVDPNSQIVISDVVLKRKGYTFLGWNTQADGDGVIYKAGEEVSIYSRDIVLYSFWCLNSEGFKVTYHGNGNVDGSTPIDANYYTDYYEVEVLEPLPEFSRPTYKFGGWATTPEYSRESKVYKPGDTFNISEDIDLYADWGGRTESHNWTNIVSNSSNDKLVAIIDNGAKNQLYYSHDSGRTWTLTGHEDEWLDLDMSTTTGLVYALSHKTAIGEPASLYRSIDYGVNWSHVITFEDGSEHDENASHMDEVHISDDESVIIVGGNVSPVVYRSTDKGSTWDVLNYNGNSVINKMAMTPDGKKIVITRDGSYAGIEISNDSGDTWNHVGFMTGQFHIIDPSSLNISNDGSTITVGTYKDYHLLEDDIPEGGFLYVTRDDGITINKFDNRGFWNNDIVLSSNGEVIITTASRTYGDKDYYKDFYLGIRYSNNFGETWSEIDVPDTYDHDISEGFRSFAISSDGTNISTCGWNSYIYRSEGDINQWLPWF